MLTVNLYLVYLLASRLEQLNGRPGGRASVVCNLSPVLHAPHDLPPPQNATLTNLGIAGFMPYAGKTCKLPSISVAVAVSLGSCNSLLMRPNNRL